MILLRYMKTKFKPQIIVAIVVSALLIAFFVFTQVKNEPQSQNTDLSPTVQELQNQSTPEPEKQDQISDRTTIDSDSNDTSLYRGYFFDIEYPTSFTSKPNEPTFISNEIEYIETNEAYFTSPDGNVEFFVFSPLWGGDPETYSLNATTDEEVVAELTDESIDSGGPLGEGTDKTVLWLTMQAKDDSYTRSLVSVTQTGEDGSELHHVFGIKYQNIDSYENYKDDYTRFKDSLRQYAD